MSETVNRREFVTAGAVTAGALALGTSRLFAQSSQSINVGIIGCGGRGGGAIINVLEADKDVKIAAICDGDGALGRPGNRHLPVLQRGTLGAHYHAVWHVGDRDWQAVVI